MIPLSTLHSFLPVFEGLLRHLFKAEGGARRNRQVSLVAPPRLPRGPNKLTISSPGEYAGREENLRFAVQT